MKLYMTLSAIAMVVAPITSAGVYVSSDSVTPLTQHQLAISQLEHIQQSTEMVERAMLSSEYMMGATIDLNREIQARADNRMEQVYQQRVELDKHQIALIDDQNQLVEERKNLEMRRIQLESNFQNKNHALIAKNAATQAAIYREQNERQDEFRNEKHQLQADFRREQSEIQAQTQMLQQQVADSQEQLLVAQIKHNAPSNVIVLSSKDATNVTARVDKTTAKSLDNITPTKTKSPLVNMNEFLRQIIPESWRYTPPHNSGNKQISLIQGRDWKSIVTTLGVQHPYLDILFDVDNKHLRITSRHGANINKPEATRSWQITRAKSLRETIEDFGKEANWQVIWDTANVDYPIVANGVITGNFSGENGVINQLMRTTQAQDFPLVAKWSKNAVRIVRRESKSRK